MATYNYKMTDGQKLANYMAELSSCVYNKLKKAQIPMGLIYPHVSKLPKSITIFNIFNPIETVEAYLNKNIKKTAGYEFIFDFDQDDIKDIFDGTVEIRYEQNDDKKFVPTVFLGMAPTSRKSKVEPPALEQEYDWETFRENYDAVKNTLHGNTFFDVETQTSYEHVEEYVFDDHFKLCVKKGNEELMEKYKRDFFDKYYLPTGWSQDDWKEFLVKFDDANVPEDRYYNLDTNRVMKPLKKYFKGNFWAICSTNKTLVEEVSKALDNDNDKRSYEQAERESDDEEESETESDDETEDE